MLFSLHFYFRGLAFCRPSEHRPAGHTLAKCSKSRDEWRNNMVAQTVLSVHLDLDTYKKINGLSFELNRQNFWVFSCTLKSHRPSKLCKGLNCRGQYSKYFTGLVWESLSELETCVPVVNKPPVDTVAGRFCIEL
jgi:hypothetical protein